MISNINKDFYKKGKEQIDNIYYFIKKELPKLSAWQLKNSFIVEQDRIILCRTIEDDKDEKFIESNIEIKYHNKNRTIINITDKSIELSKTNNDEDTIYKLNIKEEDNKIISSRSILIGTKYLTITRNITDNTIDLTGNIDYYDMLLDPNEFDDDLYYLMSCMERKHKITRIKK